MKNTEGETMLLLYLSAINYAVDTKFAFSDCKHRRGEEMGRAQKSADGNFSRETQLMN